MNKHKLLILCPTLGDNKFRTVLIKCHLQLVIVHHLVANRGEEKLLILLKPEPGLVVQTTSRHFLLLPPLSSIQLFCCSVLTLDERVGAKLLLPQLSELPELLRADRIHSWVGSLTQQLLDEIFQFLHLWFRHTCSLTDNMSPDPGALVFTPVGHSLTLSDTLEFN